MDKTKLIFTGLIVVLVAIMAAQSWSIQQVRTELAGMKQTSSPTGKPAASRVQSERPTTVVRSDTGVEQRIAELEKAVANLSRASEYLMDRGQLPMAEHRIQDALGRFMDSSLADRDRLRALELLRRSRAMSDDVAGQAIAWLQNSTNANTQRALLQHLENSTNAALKPILLALSGSSDSEVREQSIDNLRRFITDPEVESKLWQAMKNDPDGDVRREAEEALARGPFSEARIAALQQRALDPQASIDERLVAMQALNRAGANSQSVTAFLADLAQKTTDPAERLKLFRAFDGVDDPAVKLPLVYGLQDPNPLIREEAVDALSDFASDPVVKQWLQYVAQNDHDPEVRREAYSILNDND